MLNRRVAREAQPMRHAGQPRRHRLEILALLVVVQLASAACGSPEPSPSTAASASPEGASAIAAAPSASPTAAPTSSPVATPTASPVAELVPGVLALTVSSDVRVRSLPGVAADSIKYTPTLASGSSLLVTGGPVVADGITWIQVAPLSVKLAGGVDRGWVAVADHDGTPWVAVDPNPTPGYELATASVTRTVGSLDAAKREATEANAFGIELYRKLLSSGMIPASRGMVFSPTSIVDALAMARAGAKGETAT
jgi:hypothetical protein